MFGFIKKLFGAKPVEAEAPYKVEVPVEAATATAPVVEVVVEGAGVVEVPANKTPAKKTTAKKQNKKPAGPKKGPRKPRAPKAPKA